MKIYFVHSGSYEHILRKAGVNILINYAYLQDKGIPSGFPGIIIDSGGFQLQSGANFDVLRHTKLIRGSELPHNTLKREDFDSQDEYVRFLAGELDIDNMWFFTKQISMIGYKNWLHEQLPKHPEIQGFFNLDILGDNIRSLQNQIEMEDDGLKPIPVWHIDDGEDFLQYYYDRYDYIAVGGLISGMSRRNLRHLVSTLHQKYPNCRYHFFGIGVTGALVFNEWRPYSVDFSTWIDPIRFGAAIEYDDKQLIKIRSLPKEIRMRLRKEPELAEHYLTEAVERIKGLEQRIDELHNPEFQTFMI